MRRFALSMVLVLGLGACGNQHAQNLAALAGLYAAGALASAIVDAAIHEGDRMDTNEVDEHGRPARLRARVRCAGDDRSYKLLCVAARDCYFERNDGTIVHCDAPGCPDVPPALDAWCQGR
jgi:hypothetical protein